MIDGVERAGQVRVENPHPCAATGQGVEQRLDRVVTAAARPKPVRAGLEAGLPLRLQRLADTCLVAPVHDHWNAERPLPGLVMGFGDIHPFDRDGPPRAAGGVHLHRHLGPGGQRDPPIDPRGRTARVALRHLPHTDQRVRPVPQHEFLQVPGFCQVPVPYRLEDPAPQPPYPLLMQPPVHLLPGVPIEHTRRVLRSVHRGVQRALRFRHSRPLRRQRLTCPRQHPSEVPGTRPGIRPVIQPPSRRRTWSRSCRFPVVFRPPAFASWAPCPAGNSAPITLGLPAPHTPTCAPGVDPDAGLPRSTRVRPGPGRALSLPRG